MFWCLHMCWVLWHPSLIYYILISFVLLAEDDAPSKMPKVEFPSSVLPGSLGIQYPSQSTLGTLQPVYVFRFYSEIIFLPMWIVETRFSKKKKKIHAFTAWEVWHVGDLICEVNLIKLFLVCQVMHDYCNGVDAVHFTLFHSPYQENLWGYLLELIIILTAFSFLFRILYGVHRKLISDA